MKGWRDRKKIVITYFDRDCQSDTYFDYTYFAIGSSIASCDISYTLLLLKLLALTSYVIRTRIVLRVCA